MPWLFVPPEPFWFSRQVVMNTGCPHFGWTHRLPALQWMMSEKVREARRHSSHPLWFWARKRHKWQGTGPGVVWNLCRISIALIFCCIIPGQKKSVNKWVKTQQASERELAHLLTECWRERWPVGGYFVNWGFCPGPCQTFSFILL